MDEDAKILKFKKLVCRHMHDNYSLLYYTPSGSIYKINLGQQKLMYLVKN